jgi:hypothetical protein
MRRLLLLAGVCFGLTATLAWAAETKFSPIDVQPKANQKLTDDFHAANPGNNLAEVPQGAQTLGGVKFQIGERCMQLGSPTLAENGFDFPQAITGIAVGKRFSRLYLLHAMGNTIVLARDPEVLPKDKAVAKYTVHYEDGSQEVIPIIYGKDISDWWFAPGTDLQTAEPTQAKVAWEGKNEAVKNAQGDIKIRLYMTTWVNPKPKEKVTSIDFAQGKPDLPSAPFCVAITAEEE